MSKKSIDADLWSTIVFYNGSKKGLALVEKNPNIGAVFVKSDAGILLSSNLENKFKLLDQRFHLDI